MSVRLQERYKKDVMPALKSRFNYKNTMEIPRVEKVVLNIGVGEAVQNAKAIEGALADLSAIAGQKPSVRKAKRSVSNFKLREGMPIGACVTLRRDHMWEFLDRFFNFSVPRIRDFRGLSANSFDGRGNYTLGVREQIIFPEIDYDKIDQVRGLDVTFVTSARTDEEALELLRSLGMPFEQPEIA